MPTPNFVLDKFQIRDVGRPQIRSHAVGGEVLQQLNGRMGGVNRCAVLLPLKVNHVHTCDVLDGRNQTTSLLLNQIRPTVDLRGNFFVLYYDASAHTIDTYRQLLGATADGTSGEDRGRLFLAQLPVSWVI
jgi:hypothetical protein